MEVPSRTKLRALRIFNVSAASIFWQRSGNYLAAHTERYTSRKIVRDEFQQSQVKLSVSRSIFSP
jgi:uncharacterized protein with WD repeat